jgi:AraC family transcriptional regulator of adaptative response/methylated-DNA-[protein]-cysteine methyltransferase
MVPDHPSRQQYRRSPSDLSYIGVSARRRPHNVPSMPTANDRVLHACRAMEAAGGPIELPELAGLVGCSARQLQRDFSSLVGTSPRAYGEAARTSRARIALQRSDRVSDAVYSAGYGSVRAFYEETGRRLGMTPSAYAAGGQDRELLWAVTPTAVGHVLAVASSDGLCAVRIGTDAKDLVTGMHKEFPRAHLIRDDAAMADVMSALRQIAVGAPAPDVPADVSATAFQARVWEALRAIPSGETRSYQEVAVAIGQPRAVRAVARACAMNPIALVVPCHRVIRGSGELAGYRWGLVVKQTLLAAEARSD